MCSFRLVRIDRPAATRLGLRRPTRANTKQIANENGLPRHKPTLVLLLLRLLAALHACIPCMMLQLRSVVQGSTCNSELGASHDSHVALTESF